MTKTLLVTALCAFSLAGCTDSKDQAAMPPAVTGAPEGTVAPVSTEAPVLTEDFTPLACDENTTIGQQGCTQRVLLSYDDQVNRALKTLWERSDTDGRALIASAQSTWVTYRTAACKSAADENRGGTLAPVTYIGCLADLTKDRARVLASQVANRP